MELINTKVQSVFNSIKGCIKEINKDDSFCNLTLSVGNHNQRNVNLVCKTKFFENQISEKYVVGEKVLVRFYLSSSFKHGRWYTNANILDIQRSKI